MDLSALATKQKRVKDWRDFLTLQTLNPALQQRLTSTLGVYAKVLADCWNEGTVSPDNIARMEGLERELETLNDDIRLSTSETLSRSVEK